MYKKGAPIGSGYFKNNCEFYVPEPYSSAEVSTTDGDRRTTLQNNSPEQRLQNPTRRGRVLL